MAASVAKALPASVQEDYQFELLSRLADSTGVKLPSFEPGTPLPATGYQKLPLNLAITCPLENCLRFIGGLRGMVRANKTSLTAVGPLWYIDQVSLTPVEGNKVTLTMTSGMFLAPGAAGPAEAGAAPGATPSATPATPTAP